MNRDDPTISTAAKIADGTSVDWQAPDSTSSSITDPALVANLQSIAAIAALHRAPSGAGPGLAGTPWGPLTVLRPIGQGRFGQVFRAWDARLAREVALKILTTEASTAAALPSGAIDEARLLARVRHPNVLTVYGAECIDGRIGIWSELVEGQTLDQILKADGPLPPDEVASIGIDICRALAAVHDAGFVHRDVKAQNVMREVGGRIVLMDFGTVHDTALAPTLGASPAGTPLYMAPELMSRETATVASDIYAVGVLLFRLLTGQFPVNGPTVDAVQQAHAQGRRRVLKDTAADVPGPLAAAIERGLATHPADRFARAADFAESLESARRATSAALLRPPVSRLRGLAIAAGILATVAALAIWLPGTPEPGEGTATTPKPAVVPDPGPPRIENGPAPAVAPPGSAIGNDRLAAPDPDGVPRLLCRNCIGPTSSISYDGRQAIVLDDETGDLAVRDIRSGVSWRLFAKAGGWSDSRDVTEAPLLSPDGQWIAFRWVYYSPRRVEWRVMPNRRGAPGVVVLSDSVAAQATPRDWHPQNSALLTTIDRKDGRDLAWVSVPAGTITLVRSFARPGPETVVSPRVSPDGRHIAYVTTTWAPDGSPAAAGPAQLWISRANGDNLRPLTTTAASNRFPFWTADGSHVVFTTDVDGSPDLWSAAATGESIPSPVPVLRNIGSDRPRLLSPDGRYLYVDFPAPFVLSFVSPAPRDSLNGPLRILESIPGRNPSWSPDGMKLLFSRSRLDTGANTVVVRWMADQKEHTYTLEGLLGNAMWADDDTLLAPVGPGDRLGQWSLHRIDVTSGESREILTPDPSQNRRNEVALSPDGRTLYLGAGDAGRAANNPRIVAIDLTSGKVGVVTALPSWPSLLVAGYLALAMSPDGTSLAALLIRSNAPDGRVNDGFIKVIDVRDGTVQDLAGPFPAGNAFGKLVWTRDNSIWYAALDAANRPGWRIMRIPASGGEPVEVVPYINGQVNNARFDVSPDGSRLAWTPAPGYPQVGSDLAGPRSELWAVDIRQALARAGVTLKR